MCLFYLQNNQPTELGEYEEFEGFGNGHRFIKIAGKGSYGCVKLCQDNITRMEFVKKEVSKILIINNFHISSSPGLKIQYLSEYCCRNYSFVVHLIKIYIF